MDITCKDSKQLKQILTYIINNISLPNVQSYVELFSNAIFTSRCSFLFILDVVFYSFINGM